MAGCVFTQSSAFLNDAHLLRKGCARAQVSVRWRWCSHRPRLGGLTRPEQQLEPAAPPDGAAWSEEEEEELELDDASRAELEELEALGLPVAFGGCGGRRGGAPVEARQQAHSTERSAEAPPPPRALDGDSCQRWVQSYDAASGLLYYYRLATQETTWCAPPAFLALPDDALAWASSHAASLAGAGGAGGAAEAGGGPGEATVLGGRTQQPCGSHTRFQEAEEAPAAAGTPVCEAGEEALVAPKYWAQRYRYFSRFDRGCQLDADMWFSVTPEVTARHQAQQLLPGAATRLAVDAFCGCGGNALALAHQGAYVLACDLRPERLRAARHNARLYGLDAYVDWVCCDWTSLQAAVQRCRGGGLLADGVFLSPPWGGPAYAQAPRFDLQQPLAGGQAARQLLAGALALAPRAAFFLPRNVAAEDARQLAEEAGAHTAHLQADLLNGKLKAQTLYCDV